MKRVIAGPGHLVLPEYKEVLKKTKEVDILKDIGTNLRELLIAKARMT